MRNGKSGWWSVAGVLALTVALAALHPVPVTACLTPEADLYAVEVVLNKPNVKYNLSLVNAREVWYAGMRAYAYRSRLDSRLVVLLSEQPVPLFSVFAKERKYLAIRVQAPLEERTATVHSCVINLGCVQRFKEDVPLAFRAGKGELTIEVGWLFISSLSLVQFKPEIFVEVEGNASLVVSGELLLRGQVGGVAMKSDRPVEYRVSMPCLVEVNEPCFRIMMLIPGYDEPMELEAGTYKVFLTLSWSASRPAKGVLKLIHVNCIPILVAQLEATGKGLGWKVVDNLLEKVVGEALIRVSRGYEGYVVTVEGVEEVSEAVEEEIGKLLDALGLGRGVCRLVRRRELRLTPQAEVSEEEVRAALRAELEWLVREGIVTGLKAEDIAAIVKAARLGCAGWDWRLVWHEGKWVPYGTVPGALRSRCIIGVPAIFLRGSEEYRALPQAPTTFAEGVPTTPTTLAEAVRLHIYYWLWAWAAAVAVAFAAALLSYVVIKRSFPH